MTKRSFIASSLQLLGVFLACRVIAKGLPFLLMSSEIPWDWLKFFWAQVLMLLIGLGLAGALIFFAAPLTTFLNRFTQSDDDSEVVFKNLTSETSVQMFAVLLLVNTLHSLFSGGFILLQMDISIFVSSLLVIYYVATIGASIALIRWPDLLQRCRKA